MKTLRLTKLVVIFFALMAISCSKDDENSTSTPTPTSENIWKIDDFTYNQNGPINQGTSYTASDNLPFSVVRATTVVPASNGLFSNVDFTFGSHEAGIYTVKSKMTTITNFPSKNIYIEVVNGNLQGQGALYGSTDSNITVKVEKVDGKFVITAADNILLIKEVNNGLNAPNSVSFSCNKVK